MSQPLCPHGNYDTTCPLCENVWDETEGLGQRQPPWHKEDPDSLPPLPFSDGQPLDKPTPTPDQPEPKKRSSRAPFSFGSAMLEVMRTRLYDCIDLDTTVPHQLWRLFVDNAGKTDLEISPHLVSGGQLPAPRLFVVDDFRLVYQVRPEPAGVALDSQILRHDVETLKAALTVRLCVGVRDYYNGPAALLPIDLRARKLVIPAHQMFFAQLDTMSAGFTITTTYRWRVYAQLRGELGREIS